MNARQRAAGCGKAMRGAACGGGTSKDSVKKHTRKVFELSLEVE